MTDCSKSDTFSAANDAGATRTSVLIVEDDAGVAAALELLLATHGLDPYVAASGEEALHRFSVARPDLVLLDLNLSPGARSGQEGLELLGQLLQQDPHAVIIVLTAHSGVAIAVEAMRSGAHDFVMKPWANKKLIETVKAAANLRSARKSGGHPTSLMEADSDLIGQSQSIRDNRRDALKASRGTGNVLLVGEPGTGKERLARMIHRLSAGPHDRFVTLEGGHSDEGGFRQAFEQAMSQGDEGVRTETILIKSIDQLTTGDQDVLARRLATLREAREQNLSAAPRIVATIETRRPRAQAKAAVGPDLMSQVGSFEIQTKPLKDRPEDIAPIASYFMDLYSLRAAIPPKMITSQGIHALQDQAWAGNVDTLRGVVERAVHTEQGRELTPESFGLAALPDVGPDEDFNLEKAEKALLERALSRHSYNVTLAARALGLTRAALYRRMERHGV